MEDMTKCSREECLQLYDSNRADIKRVSARLERMRKKYRMLGYPVFYELCRKSVKNVLAVPGFFRKDNDFVSKALMMVIAGPLSVLVPIAVLAVISREIVHYVLYTCAVNFLYSTNLGITDRYIDFYHSVFNALEAPFESAFGSSVIVEPLASLLILVSIGLVRCAVFNLILNGKEGRYVRRLDELKEEREVIGAALKEKEQEVERVSRISFEDYFRDKETVLSVDIREKSVPDGRGRRTLLRDIAFDIRKGSLVAVLGSTGAGKSTLVNCLNGMDVSGASGEVIYDGVNILEPANFRKVRESIGSIPQENILHERRTVHLELLAAARDRLPDGTPASFIESKIDDVLKLLNISHCKNAVIGGCSGGEKRRITIATELVGNRDLLFLDEPEAGLDEQTREALFTTLRNLTRSDDENGGNRTIVAITHDTTYIDEKFDAVIFLKKARDDEESPGELGCFGNPNVILRRMEKLAEQGRLENVRNDHRIKIADLYRLTSDDFRLLNETEDD